MFRRLRKLEEKKTKKIAIIGMSDSCGTTHLAVAIANYYASKERLQVLYIECDPAKGMMGMRTKEVISIQSASGFVCREVTYLPQIAPDQAFELMTEKYDMILFETKGWQETMRGIFRACDRMIVTVNAKPWHYQTLQQNMKQMIQQEHKIVQGDYCGFNLTKEEKKKLKQEFSLQCMDIPVITDPLQLEKTDIRFLRQFLGE